MRKNGFTLIELLAVIVILAIIALIATPIILGIINDAREKSNERSVELYAASVKNGIAAYQLREGKEVEAKTYTKDTLPFEVEYDGKVDCESIIISADGKVSLDKCRVNGGTKEYSYGIEEEPSVAKVCTIEKQDESKYSVGDIVTCDIGETPEKFYVIKDTELTASTIQMLTEKNITLDESNPVQSDTAGTIAYLGENTAWYDESGYCQSQFETEVVNGEEQVLPTIYIKAYQTYLINKGVNTAVASLPKAFSMGCVDLFEFEPSNTSGTCLGYEYGEPEDEFYQAYPAVPSWVYSTSYWTPESNGYTCENYAVMTDGSVRGSSASGVRPVITISTSEIQ